MKSNQKRFLGLLITSVLFFSMTSNVFAANNEFIERVEKEYRTFESKAVKEYKEYQQSTTKRYEDYKKIQVASNNLAISQMKQDAEELNQFLEDDLKELESIYGENKEYRRRLQEYKNSISQNRTNSVMYPYAKSINPDNSTSLMWRYKTEVNENNTTSQMWKYRTAVNENNTTSPMWRYRTAVNENNTTSPMWKLRTGSNKNNTTSPMWSYRLGKISQKTASERWNKLLKVEVATLQNIVNQSRTSIKQTEVATEEAINKRRCDTIKGVLLQRSKSEQALSELRKKSFGAGLDFDVIVPDSCEVNIVFNNKWLYLEQPATNVNGKILVPMKAVFEKMGADIKWNEQTKSVTATKDGINIFLTIDKNTATINGKTVSLEASPKIINGNVMVPFRFVGEALGAEVDWEAETKSVIITSNE